MTKKGEKKTKTAAAPKMGSKPSKTAKPQQMKIPGTERKSVPEIDSAAEADREVRDQRMALTKDETQKQKELLDVVKKHGVTEYVYEDGEGEEMSVKVDDVVKVKVKKLKADAGDDE